MSDISAKEIKSIYPEEWELLQKRVQAKSKPDLPKKVLNELEREAKALLEGRLIKFGPTDRHPLAITCFLAWEEGTGCDFKDIEDVAPRKGAGKREITLIKLFRGLMDFSDLYDSIQREVMKSPEAKAYNKDIKDFCKKGEALEKTYGFDFDDWLTGLCY